MTTTSDRSFSNVFRTSALVLCAGATLSLCACNNSAAKSSRKAAPDPMLEDAMATPKEDMKSPGEPSMHMHSSVATTTPTTPGAQPYSANGYYNPNSTSAMPRRPGKMDPFWIELTAEADRAIWDAPAMAAQSPNQGIPNNPLADSVMANAPMTLMRDDGAEGLSHVTFAAEGADFDPCISRDGAFMVFASTQHRPTADIYMKRTDGRTITQLTSDPANDVMPSISPDSGRIAFASNRAGNWDIFVMSRSGGQAVQVTSDPAQELHPTWSSDGKFLAYCKMGQISGRWEVWVTDVNNGASAEFVGFGMFPEWCPKAGTGMDGRDKILFQRSRERGGRAFSVWTIDYAPGDASSPTEIASSPTSAMINASWSPDGQRVVFATIENSMQQSAANSVGTSSYPSVVSDLWMSNIDGSGRVNLTSGQFMNLMPCWGADGRIYFVSDRSGVPNVWSMTTDKAIRAATGNVPSHPQIQNHGVANVPDQTDAEGH